MILFGSYGTEDYIPGRSDIDVAILSYSKDPKKNHELLSSIIGLVPSTYDIKIFESLPLYIQISIINQYEVIFGDPLDISEYFYEYRKEFRDMEDRIKENQFESIDEQLEGIERRKRLLNKPKF